MAFTSCDTLSAQTHTLSLAVCSGNHCALTGFLLWGPNAEVGHFPTSSLPTAGHGTVIY